MKYILVSLMVITSAMAEVRLPNCLSDNMVVQRDLPIRVWGFAANGEKVTVTFGQRSGQAVADAQGHWLVTLESLPASATPASLVLTGKNTITLTNILVGDVWLCSGQSNMAWWLNVCDNAKEEIANAKHPGIRFLNITGQPILPAPGDNIRSTWAVCTPQTAKDFSGVGYFFGREIHERIGVPIGLIGSAVGGTSVEAWIPQDTLFAEPHMKKAADAITAKKAKYEESVKTLPKRLEEWEILTKKMLEDKPELAKNPRDLPAKPSTDRKPEEFFSGRYNGIIAPLTNLSIRGVIWYQGESSNKVLDYRDSFQALIRAWRGKFRQEDMPFLFVQLPRNLPAGAPPQDDPNKGQHWGPTREAQAAALELPNTGMAIAIDLGDPKSLHPRDKQPVAHRLALAARAIAYGEKDLVYSGPLLEGMTVEGDKIRLRFKHVGSGLMVKGDKLSGFAIAGKDKKYVWADAILAPGTADAVLVSSPTITQPAMVRHCWGGSPSCALYNKEGLPAAPFRTGEISPK